jgi:hypothetical protein
MSRDDHDDIIQFMDVDDEALLTPNHDEMPIYIPTMKCTLSIGHFIILSTSTAPTVIGQIVGRSNDQTHPQQFINICCYLPLYDIETMQYIHNPSILPRRICSTACLDVVELVNITKIAKVNIASIKGLAFVFLESDVNNHIYYIQGMTNAFIIRFKFCIEKRDLVSLDNSSFHCFPDLHPVHRMAWNECYGRTIYTSIDHLRQQIWRFLCRYGASQGIFPRQLIQLYYPTQFTNYLCNFLVLAQVPFEVKTLQEPQHRVESKFIYRMVSASQEYKLFNLDTAERVELFGRLIGATSIFGIRKRKPKLGSEVSTKRLDAINVLSRLELYISYSMLKIRLYAYKHIVGEDATMNHRLLEELGETHPSADEHPLMQATPATSTRSMSSLRINSKFDYNGNVCKVLSVNSDGMVLTSCLWGPHAGEEITFDSVEEVARLVNLKRG